MWWQQLRLLLWKDYLVRKRKLVTLGGIIWATAVMLSLYIVRINIDNVDFPTCQFPARALPSAGLLPFVQSFLCTINNECSPMDQYDEIPSYENARLTHLQRQISPLLSNETVLDVAVTVPDALKLVSKLAEIVDEPTFTYISKHGLRVRALFRQPEKVRRDLATRLQVSDDVIVSLMDAEISFGGIMKGNLNRCSSKSISEMLLMDNPAHLNALVDRLCAKTDTELKEILMGLLTEVDFSKYIRMIGNMYSKLNGDNRLTAMADTLTAVLRMTRVHNFLPKELSQLILKEQADFSYVDLSLITKLMDLFKPTFGETESYKNIRDFSDAVVLSLEYLGKFLAKNNKTDSEKTENRVKDDMNKTNTVLNNAVEVFKEMGNDTSMDVFSILSKVSNFIHKWLPDDLKHDVLFYATLLTKLVEGANKVIEINMHIEERAYDVSLRHPHAIKALVGLPGTVIAKGFEGLADAERTQTMTAKISSPGQMFCDINRLQIFFQVSTNEASNLKTQLCTDHWKNYATDLIKTFGIYEVKDTINSMASLVIQETLGKDTSDQLYPLDHDFRVLKNLTSLLGTMEVGRQVAWSQLFNVTEDSEFMKAVRSRAHLGKQMLITVHGALAKEVVQQNPLLSFKITPVLIDVTTLVEGINRQLAAASSELNRRVREAYPQILVTMLKTLMDENKTYKSLSVHSVDILCNGVDNAYTYLEFEQDIDREKLVSTLCDITSAIEDGLKNTSHFAKALENIQNPTHGAFDEVKWTDLITGLKDLYVTLEREYPYLFEYASYNMDGDRRKSVEKMVAEAKRYWFGDDLGRSVHLGLKLGFRLLDLMDRPVFNITDSDWGKLRYGFDSLTGPLAVLDDFVLTISAISSNNSYESALPPLTVEVLSNIIPNVPRLVVDVVTMVIGGDIELSPIISLLNGAHAWPCSSITEVQQINDSLTPGSKDTVRSLEAVLCKGDTLRQEWKDYLDKKNVRMFDLKKWNTTTLPAHIFLKISSSLDSLIQDGGLVKELVLGIDDIVTNGGVTWANVLHKVSNVFKRQDKDISSVFRDFFSKLDKVLESVNVTYPAVPLNAIWKQYVLCNSSDCTNIGRAAWKGTLQFLSVMATNAMGDLITYFEENNEPNANILQLLGFTKSTPLYEMYEKAVDLVGVLINSYTDFGFMIQVRRAYLSEFWDCDALVEALKPALGSPIDGPFLDRIRPYVCPSFLYWLSLPRGENSLLDVVAKPQYYFYSLDASNLTSNFEEAYNRTEKLTILLSKIANKSKSLITEEDIRLNSLQGKLERLIENVTNYKIRANDTSYELFYETNMKQIISTIYLTRVTTLINKINTLIQNYESKSPLKNYAEEDLTIRIAEIDAFQKTFKRKPTEFLMIYFDVITNLVSNKDDVKLNAVIDSICDGFNNETHKDTLILADRRKMKRQICFEKHSSIYEDIEKEIKQDYAVIRQSLFNLVNMFHTNDGNITDAVQFLKDNKQLINFYKNSMNYAYDLGIHVYLEYLYSNIQHYDIIISFLSHGDWWKALRELYHGPYAEKFFDTVEKSLDIAEDVLTNLDDIHVVRLLRDIDVNNTETFCSPEFFLSEYIPDRTEALSELKDQICEKEKEQLYMELIPLTFPVMVAQGTVKTPRDINYTKVSIDVSNTESSLDVIKGGPLAPQTPLWVTDENVQKLKVVASGLLSKESLTRLSFGLIGNVVDGFTLFLNNSQCTLCSPLTAWIKQLNLQVFKKQEYDALYCHIDDLTLEEVHHTLKNDFHWDMAVRELISTRNYTNIELNKSLNEFLELIKLHLLEDMLANNTRLTQCLVKNVTRNGFGNATLVVTILAHTCRLLRAEVPHLHEIDGIKNMPYLKQLESQIAPNLDVWKPLKRYLSDGKEFEKDLKMVLEEDLVKKIENGYVNLRMIGNELITSIEDILKLKNITWSSICLHNGCDQISKVIKRHINVSRVDIDLPALQTQAFWRLTFVSSILEATETLLLHLSRLLAASSRVDVTGALQARMEAMVDLVMELLTTDGFYDILNSINGVVEQLNPLLNNTSLEFDIKALATGLSVMHQFKNYLVNNHDLKVQVSRVFSNPDKIESGLSRLGINNTNFWSVAAPRVHDGYIQLKPLFDPQPSGYQISTFVCQPDQLARVITPTDLGVVTLDDVMTAITEQFCNLHDSTVKDVVPVLVQNVNYSAVFDMLSETLLPQLYAASNLTYDEGAAVLDKFPKMAAILPAVQGRVSEIADMIAKEPLVKSLSNFTSVGGLLGSPSFLSDAGTMLCGRPFQTNQNRFYQAVAASQDFSQQPDDDQLQMMPTDFCRNLYKDVISREGGKIMWSFVKPLITGKILFTPPTPAVTRIIEKANATFSRMIQLSNLVQSFARSFPAVDQLYAHREGVSALRKMAATPGLKEALIGDGEVPDLDLDGVFEQFGDIKSIGSLLKQGSELVRCADLNRFRPVSDEDQLARDAGRLARVNDFSAGLVFLNAVEKDGMMDVEYKIRMDIENVPTTTKLKNYLWIPGPESSFIEHLRYFRGFVQIQDMVDQAIIQLSHSNTTRSKRETKIEDDWDVYTQQEPYPCYRKDYFQTSLYESQALMVALFFSLLFTVSSAVRFLVSDRETGNTMLMSIMGVHLSTVTASWFIVSIAELAVTSTCVTAVIWWGAVLPRTDVTLLMALFMLFGCSVLAFCYMLSKLFASASVAAACTAIAYLMSFMPFIIILSLEAVLTSSLKLFVCLSMSSAMCYSLLCIARSEATGVGVGWSDIWTSDGTDMNIATGAGMIILDMVIYMAIGLILERYFGIKSKQGNITHSMATTEKAGVSIVNVSKVFHAGTTREKVALDNVSIELHKGQITTLLGHNGAGKTTLINILTGTVSPSGGHVVIRSSRQSPRVGACPQRDVLIAGLTAREHVRLYGRLKGGGDSGEVDRMLSVLSLGAVCEQPVRSLSGGTRRRLCVALAFVGRPRLVCLDEPTAGVDPPARREIWSMIMALKSESTILLTTHHLDEAELLSDQVVILHKGQIHTTGSPIEIKRSLGNGYKLTAVYPAPAMSVMADQECAEERVKMLLTAVRNVIKNASLAEISGTEVDVLLPFFDADGVQHDFLRLCSALECSQPALGFSGYSLDCSTLEQVFFNICQRADTTHAAVDFDPDGRSKSASASSVACEGPLVPRDGPLRGATAAQLAALLHARFLHYTRNRWLLFLILVVPALFVTTAMAFSMIRPPADSERPLPLPALYQDYQYLVPNPTFHSGADPSLARRVMDALLSNRPARNWTTEDTPDCECAETKQLCDDLDEMEIEPEMMVVPDVSTLNTWIVNTHDNYIEKRYIGYSSSVTNNKTHLIAWYNNKGHHALPASINAINNALLRTLHGGGAIVTYSHPLKISKEQISKDTVYQHIADAGISGLVLVAYALVSAGSAIYLVGGRVSQEKRLALLSGVTPALYWLHAGIADMTIIVLNMSVTAVIFEAFGFPVFVHRNNLPAICLLILLYGFACGSFVHLSEKLFSDASVANMVLFCGNAFAGLAPITLLLILDIISESDETDNARNVLHTVFLVLPQFALGDGLLEIAKNTIQAQVLIRFGMDTYKDPLTSELIRYHYLALVVVGSILCALNLAIEYDYFEVILARFRKQQMVEYENGTEDADVAAERKRVHAAVTRIEEQSIRLPTLGNINAGYINTEVKNNSITCPAASGADVALCVSLGKEYGGKAALSGLTIGIPPGQCTALLGENGAGKSTTFAILTGAVRPSAGRVYLTGRRVKGLELCQGLVSYCPQSDAVDPLLTVTEILRFYCKLRGITTPEQVIDRAVEMFDLTAYRSVASGALSGGNRRKLCAAIALMGRAPLVLLDEPTSGMDPVSRRCLSRAAAAASASGRGLLLATHQLRDARRLAARLALLAQGTLRALAPLHDCLNRFGGGYVVAVRSRTAARAIWQRARELAPQAVLTVLHSHSLHFLLPTTATVGDKQVTTSLSDVFRLMASLQAASDIEDYTVNQSSLEQMFLSFTERKVNKLGIEDLEPPSSPFSTRTDSERIDITSL